MSRQHDTLEARRPSWRSRRPLIDAVAIVALLLAMAGRAPAAVIQATPATDTIDAGEQVVVELAVQLGAGETASTFEADFQLVGLGTIAGVTLVPGGPTWTSVDGSVAGGFAMVSLTSNNAGSTRRVGQLTVTGTQAGKLEVRLGADTILQRDLAASPFIENVPLATAAGALLATINVVPEPDAFALGASAAVALLQLQRRRARSRSSTATKFS
jgi:hypothetical protein